MASRPVTAGSEHGATAPGRCTHCGARLRQGEQWCGLCLTPIALAELTEPDVDETDVDEPGPDVAEPDLAETRFPGTDVSESDVPGPALTPERIDQLLERLAAAETRPDPRSQLGVLGNLHGRAGGLLLAGALGLILLAGGMLSLYLVGSLI